MCIEKKILKLQSINMQFTLFNCSSVKILICKTSEEQQIIRNRFTKLEITLLS